MPTARVLKRSFIIIHEVIQFFLYVCV